MAARTIVVVGGALSGPVAAARARENNERARIILLERAREANYSVGGIAQVVSGEARTPLTAQRERAEELRDTWRIEVRTGIEVTGLDVKKRAVKAGRERIAYDALIFAGGCESVMPDIPGMQGATNVVAFRTLRDADAILAARATGARRVVVLGGGSMGVEAADALARAGMTVTLLERKPRILSDFSPVMSDIAEEGLRALGVNVVTSAKVTDAERDDDGDTVMALGLGRSRRVHCDLVVVAAGVRPRTSLLTDAGAAALPGGALLVDDACLTTLDRVYACGTCVALPSFWTEKPSWSAQASIADRTAQVAGAAAAGGADRIGEPFLGTMLVRAGERVVGRTGLTRADAAKACAKGELGIVITEAPAVDPFVGNGDTIVVELRYDRDSGSILGGDVGGTRGVDKRLDVLAMGLHGVIFTPQELAEIDLGHSPAFSPVRDPLNVAGSVATAHEQGLVDARTAESLAKARVTIVDVRPAAAGGESTAKGARRIPLAELRDRLKELPASRPLVFVDDTGRLGHLATLIARGRGRADAAYVTGGLRAWRAAGLPVDGGATS